MRGEAEIGGTRKHALWAKRKPRCTAVCIHQRTQCALALPGKMCTQVGRGRVQISRYTTHTHMLRISHDVSVLNASWEHAPHCNARTAFRHKHDRIYRFITHLLSVLAGRNYSYLQATHALQTEFLSLTMLLHVCSRASGFGALARRRPKDYFFL
jgi:hypothetical protein